MLKVVSATFVKTATRGDEWPAGHRPEFAFVGRSNVGKSSMLNALVRKTGLARVSSTPGRTQALQFFEVVISPSPAQRDQTLRFCDLPGYGFAKVPRAEQDRWASMIEEYLRTRPDLRAVVLIVDGRHPPTEGDRGALGFLLSTGRSVVVAVTKMDKLAKSHRLPAILAVERDLGLPPGSAVPFSAVEGTGTHDLWGRLYSLAQEGPVEPSAE